MSILGNKSKRIFCEGVKDGFDNKFFSKYFIEKFGVTIIPLEGKWQFKNFISGYITAQKEVSYLAIRDRDFDVEPSDKESIIVFDEKKNILGTYRASIENYFIDADLIHQYVTWLAQTPKHKEKNIVIPSTIEIANLIEQSAKEIKYYTAVRWALSKLKPTPNETSFPDTWTGGSGNLPQNLDLENCRKEAITKIIDTFHQRLKTINQVEFELHLEVFLQLFSEKSFYQNQKYLTWFHGKDLKKALQKKLSETDLRRINFSLDTMIENHICNIDGNCPVKIDITKYADLIELKNRINE
ncbi:MAG: DUF4435 domain-containing protein [Thermoflexibacter sp.]|nr:DUF4435 domain-containing protein [Thermoflexibacter sp.]